MSVSPTVDALLLESRRSNQLGSLGCDVRLSFKALTFDRIWRLTFINSTVKYSLTYEF